MSSSGRLWSATRTRRTVQVASLLLFAGLLLWVRPRPAWEPGWPSKLFFLIDPLLLLATWLAAHAVPVALLASLAVVAVTLVLGRVFCGWICPLGTVHAAAGRVLFRIWPNRKRRDHWSAWQRSKYYLLVATLEIGRAHV
jgi:polyferredoxin